MISGPFQGSNKIQIVCAQHIFTFFLNPMSVVLRQCAANDIDLRGSQCSQQFARELLHQRVKFYALHTLMTGSYTFAYQLRLEQYFQAGMSIMGVTKNRAEFHHSGDRATRSCQRTKRDEELLNRFFQVFITTCKREAHPIWHFGTELIVEVQHGIRRALKVVTIVADGRQRSLIQVSSS